MEPEDFLEHYGVKGMRWGVRKDRDGSGRRYSPDTKDFNNSKRISKEDKKFLNDLGLTAADSENLAKKYGPPGAGKTKGAKSEKEGFRLTDKQKDYLVLGAKIAAIASAVYVVNKYGQKVAVDKFVGKDADKNLKDFWKHYSFKTKDNKLKLLDDDTPVSLDAGTILNRISSVKETSLTKGFDGEYSNQVFASYDPDDVQRYKAALPIFWQHWGVENPDGGGYVVNIAAKKALKAPSPKETFEIFKKELEREGSPLEAYDVFFNGNKEAAFFAFANQWNQPKNDAVEGFQKTVKKLGYNALVDINDAGGLSKSPLLVLDASSNLKISGHDTLTLDEIKTAQKNVKKVIHSMLSGTDDFLAHYGVKGMKWGVRRTAKQLRESASKRSKGTERPESTDSKRARELGKNTARQLSNKEIQEFNKRMNLEAQYNNMNPGRITKGQKQVAALLGVGATINSVIAFSKSPAGQAIKKTFK
jgi:hypothetical protein